MRKEANGGVSDSEPEVNEEDDAGWSDWEDDSSSSDASSAWEDVSSDEDDLVISDSEDEEREKRRKERRKRKLKVAKDDEDETAEDVAKKGQVKVHDVEQDREEGDEDVETKSVVSAATTEVSLATKKLSLLAQQKVSFRVSQDLTE